MSELIQRLSEAEEGSRGLDGLIARDVEGWLPYFDLDGNDLIDWPDMGGHWHQPDDPCNHTHSVDSSETGPHRDPPCYTTSIDAALALVERVLPDDWNKPTIDCEDRSVEVWNNKIGTEEFKEIKVEAVTIPLAICIALLKAMETQNETGS